MKRNLLLFLAGLLVVPLSARAGAHNTGEVSITSIVVGTNVVHGSLRGASASADTMQYITVRNSGNGYSYVMVRDVNARYLMCSTTDPLKIQALVSVNPASNLQVTMPDSGTCGAIDVFTGSMWMP